MNFTRGRTPSLCRSPIRRSSVRYVDDLLAIDPRAFGRRPPDLAELLTDLALGSPVDSRGTQSERWGERRG